MFVYCYVSHGTAVTLFHDHTSSNPSGQSHFTGTDPVDPNGEKITWCRQPAQKELLAL